MTDIVFDFKSIASRMKGDSAPKKKSHGLELRIVCQDCRGSGHDAYGNSCPSCGGSGDGRV